MTEGRAAIRGSLEILCLVGIGVLVALYAIHPIFSVDFFWHLKLGQVIDGRGEIPRVDLFSAVHPERPHVQFNWLWDLATYKIYAIGGLTAVRVVQAFLLIATYMGLYWVLRGQIGRAPFAFLVVALALVLFEDRFRARPSALTLGFALMLVPLLMGGYRRMGATGRVAVAALALLWGNVHGGASLLMLVSFGAVSVGAALDGRAGLGTPEEARRAYWLLGASAAGLVLSPTLVPGMLHWIVAVRPQIATGNEEWQPTWTMLRNGFTPAFVTIAAAPTVVAIAYVASSLRRVRAHGRAAGDLGEWLLCGGYLLLAHQAVRNAFLCFLPLAFMLRRAAANADVAALRRQLTAAGAGALVLVAVSFHDAILQGYGGLSSMREYARLDLAPGAHPVHAARFLHEAGIEGGILNEGSWGGYLIFHTWPECHVFVDTRHNLTDEMSEAVLASHDPVRRPAAMERAFLRWGVELAVFRGPTFPLIKPLPTWRLLFKAGDEEVYQHVSGDHARQNFERAREWLSRQTSPIGPRPEPEALARAAIETGAQLWLAEPLQLRRMAAARRDVESGERARVAQGTRVEGELLHRAGLHRDALGPLHTAAREAPDDPRPRYLAALSHFALDEPAQAREMLDELAKLDRERLPLSARNRLALLDHALRTASR